MGRIRILDFLRGIAVILVLFRHFDIVPILYQIGWIGVDLFFVLSGFLVSGLLFNEYKEYNGIQSLRFLIRRGFKIYPLFYLTIFASYFIEKFSNTYPTPHAYDFISELLFVQNYFGQMWNHTWSLAIEEHFYFGLTFVVYLLIQFGLMKNKAVLLSLFIVSMLTCISLRFVNGLQNPFHVQSHLFPTHLRLDSLLFGVFLSYLKSFHAEYLKVILDGNKRLVLAISLSFLSMPFLFKVEDFWMNTIGLSLLYFAFGGIMVLMLNTHEIEHKMNRYLSRFFVNLISRIGVFSYAIYLFHMPVRKYLKAALGKIGMENIADIYHFALYFTLSILVGMILSKLVEIPFLNLREKICPKRKIHPNLQVQ